LEVLKQDSSVFFFPCLTALHLHAIYTVLLQGVVMN
jgi:hypothetical protein